MMKQSSIQIEEDHLCVISDLHLGNPAFLRSDYLKSFIMHLAREHTSLCINGDGVDLLQGTTRKLVKDLRSAVNSFKDFISQGSKKVYYVLGNHDTHLEPYLAELGIFSFTPFLEVISGGRRIHIEHGHAYDYRYNHFPKLFHNLSKVLGKLLIISPNLFHLFFKIEWFFHVRKNKKVNGSNSVLVDAHGNFSAARALFARGFDIVILAHTHLHGLHVMENGKIFANAGAWTSGKLHYLEIKHGAISLKEWY
ncbi:MAG: metallophosphoesterase [Desulfobaccales bacterium]